jgi:hypothetical protein
MLTDNKKEERKTHSISIDNRARCSMSGIEKVIGATEGCITAQSSYGLVTIIGSNLKLTAFSESNGSLSFTGEISSIKYGSKTSALKRIFK